MKLCISVKFQFLDLIEYNSGKFVVLLPAEDEEIGEVVILKLEDNDRDEESYVSVDDEQTLSDVFDIFKKKFSENLILLAKHRNA